jgi:hypothetical protein
VEYDPLAHEVHVDEFEPPEKVPTEHNKQPDPATAVEYDPLAQTSQTVE